MSLDGEVVVVVDFHFLKLLEFHLSSSRLKELERFDFDFDFVGTSMELKSQLLVVVVVSIER